MVPKVCDKIMRGTEPLSLLRQIFFFLKSGICHPDDQFPR